ncbi:MAG: hypothetical protein ACM3ML_27785 [Micromonosporaceae bacterium]
MAGTALAAAGLVLTTLAAVPAAAATPPLAVREFVGSMISLDDPRHARLRRIVSRAFTPRMIKKFADDVAAGRTDR